MLDSKNDRVVVPAVEDLHLLTTSPFIYVCCIGHENLVNGSLVLDKKKQCTHDRRPARLCKCLHRPDFANKNKFLQFIIFNLSFL